MLYVAAGLAVMFGLLAFLGLGAINQATDLVFRERLASAHTTASILERDFADVAIETREEAEELLSRPADASSSGQHAAALLARSNAIDPSPFFRVSGIWLLDPTGRLLDEAGSPAAEPSLERAGPASLVATALASKSTVLRALGPVDGATPLAAMVVPVGGAPGAPGMIVVIHTVSLNSTAPYVPAALGRAGLADGSAGAVRAASSDQYHLEVINQDGIAVLGIGADERPGEPSPHFKAIQDLIGEHGAATLLHEPAPADSFEPHVMAVVPVAATPFYLVLEQPIDVALALPLQLRESLFLSIALGFIATLGVAWVTTRHVVKPTEELTAAAQRMAMGDLASPVAVHAQDEVGELALSLDVMRIHLQEANAAAAATNRELESRVAERTARLGDVLRRTISAQEEERHRLARELHDETAQTLAALSIALDRARDSLANEGSAAERHVQDAKAIATRLLSETRRLILGLRPAVLDDLGLIPAVRWQCETSLSERGIEATVVDNLGGTRLPAYVEVALFRIVQEAVTNVARHADASHVRIELSRTDGTVTVVVADDGKGFDVDLAMGPIGSADSVGIVGMRERVALLNGTMEIRSAPGSGTTVVVRMRPTEAIA